jgi:hypothetical protein
MAGHGELRAPDYRRALRAMFANTPEELGRAHRVFLLDPGSVFRE